MQYDIDSFVEYFLYELGVKMMFWYFLFGVTAIAEIGTEGAREREACLRYEIEKLKGSKSSEKPSLR